MAAILTPQPHPRRVPANESVSLRHHPSRLLKSSISHRASNSSGSLSTGNNGKNRRSINPNNSSGETSNAEHWFNDSNLAVSQHKMAYNDTDSPFFIDNQASESPLYNNSQSSNALLSIHQPPAMILSGTSAEYRSVIDDLTVENKRLRKRLGRYERHRDNSQHLQNEKLFEVKVHGLSSRKKRELEETLRKFALDLNASSVSSSHQHTPSVSTAAATASESSVNPVISKHTSSMTSKFADSGYGSLTTGTVPSSARASTVRSAKPATQKPNDTRLSESRHDKVQSYLHDIPQGLLPRSRPSITMTERSKKKLVVQRLEQIFTGRGPRLTGNQQSLQQQEVSQTAAKDDRSALEATGRKASAEGIREARIMDDEAEEDAINPSMPSSNLPIVSNAQVDVPDTGADSPYPQQRPTRPLDLDPDRAQVPADNIRYIRHLGPFTRADGVKSIPTMNNENWVYFNLLFNLAQLHTINVTTDFVKTSILECNSHLELSPDGRKVRWKGGDRSARPSTTSPLRLSSSPRKRELPLDLQENIKGPSPKKTNLFCTISENGKFNYNPLPPHRHTPDNESDASMPMSDSPSSTQEEVASPPFATALRSFPNRRRPKDGPITFYNNALFCTDLSGDSRWPSHPYKTSEYSSCTDVPLGMPIDSTALPVDTNFPQDLSSQPPSIEDLHETASLDIDWTPARLSPKHVMFAEPEEPFFLQASGIGGVTPADNFAITVLRQRVHKSPPCTSSQPNKITPAKFTSILEPAKASQIEERLLFARQTTLKPSPLPEPLMHFSPSSDDCDSDASADHLCQDYPASSAPLLTTASFNDLESTTSTTAGRAFYASSPQSVDETEADDDDDEDEDDQSLDFLAGARVVDPEAIRAEEREFDAEMAERLAEEIPAGSSAATAGGGCGSGFDSSDNYDVMEQDDGGSVSS